MKLRKLKYPIILFVVIYRCILDIFYTKLISPIYSYAGYTSDTNTTQYIFSWLFLLFILPSFIIALSGKDRFWKYVSYILLCLKFVPLTVVIGHIEYPTEYLIQTFIFWLIFIVGYNTFPSFKTVDLQGIKRNKQLLNKTINILIILFTFSVLFVSIKYTGFRLHTSLFDVYDIRFEEREQSYPKLFNYLLAASTVLCPLILNYFIDKKKHLLTLLFCFIIYVDFSIAGLKSIIFMTFISIALRIIYKPAILYYVPIIACIVLCTAFFMNDALQLGMSFIIWRSLFVPSGMDFEYYTFFNIFEPDFYRNSIFRRFGLESPYSQSSVDIAVGEYFNPEIEGIRANNGLISEAYANFGNLGCIIFPLILIIYIKFISSFAKYTEEKYLILIAFIFSYAIISTFIPATFMSSGVVYMIFFLVAYNNIQEHDYNLTQNYRCSWKPLFCRESDSAAI